MRRLLAATTILAGLAAAPQASAAPTLHQNVTGSPGAWTIEYTIINNDPADAPFIVSYLGINAPGQTITGSPLHIWGDPWFSHAPMSHIVDLNPPDTNHTIAWSTFVHLGVYPGLELDGFLATSTETDMPAYAPWVMQMWGGDGASYPGTSPYVNTAEFPIFTGTAISTPEPASAALALMGLLGLAAARRRR